MQSYKRKITYFYQHHNGNVGSTAGFLKLEIRGDKVKIIINIQEPSGLPYKEAALYFYHEAGDHLVAVRVGNVESVSGVLVYQARTDWQQMFDTGRDLYTFDGVAVVYNDAHYYIGDFQDKDRKNYDLVYKENKKESAQSRLDEKAEEKVLPHAEEERTANRESGRKTESPERIADQNEGRTNREETTGQSEERRTNGEKTAGRNAEEGVNRERTAGRNTEEGVNSEKTAGQNTEEGVNRERTAGSNEERRTNERGVSEQRTDNIETDSNSIGPEEETEVRSDVFEKCKSCPYHKKRMEQKEQEDAFEKMIAEYPKLPMYGVTELFDCVRIHPKDIGKLDMRNWKLGVNSFLTHGYYTYQYLLLGKMRFDNGSERAIIGVPGVYSNREKYLANMFGFEQFIPIKKTGIKTGEFGYWIVEISPYL